jgi:hypothetical protein
LFKLLAIGLWFIALAFAAGSVDTLSRPENVRVAS